MVVARGDDAQVIRGGNGGGVRWLAVSDCKSVFGNGGFANIVACFAANEEAFVADGSIEGCSRALVGAEEASVDVGLLVVEIELATVGLLDGKIVGQDFSLEALGQVVFEFELGVKGVGGCPCLR